MPRLNGFEAWRRIVVPLKSRSEAKRNALHSLVHNPPKSCSLAVMIDDLDEWEKTVKQFALCDGVLTEADGARFCCGNFPRPSVPHCCRISGRFPSMPT